MFLKVIHGQCETCGKLTAPVVSSSVMDLEAKSRLRLLAAGRSWTVIVVDSTKTTFRCPMCAKELTAIGAGDESPTVTMVTDFHT